MIAVIRGPYSHRRRHTLRRFTAGGRPASTAARDQLVLGHPHRHRGQVKHLPPLHTHLGRVSQIGATADTRTGLTPQPLMRIGDQRQRRARMPPLPTRLAPALAPALAPQRLRRGLDKR